MKARMLVLTGPLSRFVENIIMQDSEPGEVKQILPTTSIVLSFQLHGKMCSVEKEAKVSLPAFGISGLRKTSRQIQFEEKTSAVLVFLREGAAFELFKMPVCVLFGQHPSMANLISSGFDHQFEDMFCASKSDAERVAAIESLLLPRLINSSEDPLIVGAVAAIRTHRGNIKIRDLTERIPISIDAFEKRFKRLIGSTPKQYASIVRMRYLIARHSRETTLTETAADAGFFDQSHFIREFERFTGQTPRQYFGGQALRQAR